MPEGSGRPLKIVMLVTNPVRPERPDPRVFREAQALRAAGHAVAVIAWDREGECVPVEDLEDIHITRIRTPAQYGSGTALVRPLLGYWRRTYRRLMELEWDVVHCHDLDTLLPGVGAARRCKKAVVFDSHESYPDFISPRVPAPVVWLVRYLERLLVPRTSAVIAVGNLLAERLKGLGARRVVVVGNWHDPESVAISAERRQMLREAWGCDDLVVCYVGGFGPNRALPELIAAVKQVQGTTLVLAGAGSQRATVEKLIKGCDRVVDLGVISYRDALEIKAASDVVYRATRAEGVPNARYSSPNNLFEALAAGAAVIASDNGDLGRIVREAECGVVIGDITVASISEALESMKVPAFLDRMKANATEAALTKYNWREASQRLLALYTWLGGNQ